MIKLDYFDCISPLPLEFTNVGKIKSPKLIDIAEISYYMYSIYIAHLRMTPEEYFEAYHKDEEVDFDYVLNLTKFDLVKNDDRFRKIIQSALNFFFEESFEYFPEYSAFLSVEENDDGKTATGIINDDNYAQVVEVILQRVHIEPDENEVDDISKIKNKRGRKIYEKMMKRRKKFKKAKANNPDLTMANIIAAVATRSSNLNWVNIWDITVFHLFDEFERLQINDQYNIASTQVAAWGDKDNKFKFGLWSKNIYDKQENAG